LLCMIRVWGLKRKVKKYTRCLSVMEEQDAQQRTDEVQGGQAVKRGERGTWMWREVTLHSKCHVNNRTVKSDLL